MTGPPDRQSLPTAGPVTSPLAPDGPVSSVDPTLEPFAEFALVIGSAFYTPFSFYDDIGTRTIYDAAIHRYHDEYIHPRGYSLTVSAQPGLVRAKAEAAMGVGFAHASAPTHAAEVSSGVATVEEFHRLMLARRPRIPATTSPGDSGVAPGSGFDPGSGLLSPPKGLDAYEWFVERVDQSWHDHHIVVRPDSNKTVWWFSLPSLGAYDMSLRVHFGDRYFERTVRFQLRELFIVSLGDSFASGEGNPDAPGETGIGGDTICETTTISYASGLTPPMSSSARWMEGKAHRSLNAGPALAAESLQRVFGETWSPGGLRGKDFVFYEVVFASFARSGASIIDGLIRPQGGEGDFVGAGQLEECRRTAAGRPIDALLISIGGNDVGFSGVLSGLVSGDNYYGLSLPGMAGDNRRKMQARLDKLLGVNLPAGEKGDVEVRLETLAAFVEEQLKVHPGVGQVYLSGYPTDLFFVKDAAGQVRFRACDVFQAVHQELVGGWDISQADAELIRSRGQALNSLLARKAAEFGWHFVPTEADFVGHGYCATDSRAMFVRAESSCKTQGDFEGTMHPNARGHAAYGLRLRQALLSHTMPAPGPVNAPLH